MTSATGMTIRFTKEEWLKGQNKAEKQKAKILTEEIKQRLPRHKAEFASCRNCGCRIAKISGRKTFQHLIEVEEKQEGEYLKLRVIRVKQCTCGCQKAEPNEAKK